MTNAQVKQGREKDIERLHQHTGLEERECRRIMTSFYRLSALDYRLMELENDAWFYEHRKGWLDRESDRAYNWLMRLCKELEPYGLKVRLSGGYAHLETTDGQTFTHGYFYN